MNIKIHATRVTGGHVTSEMMTVGKGVLSLYTVGTRFIPQRDLDRLSGFVL